MPSVNKLTPFIWFDGQAEEAAKLYTNLFPDSEITRTTHYLEAGRENHGQVPGSVMTVEISLMGHPFVLLNGGPHFKLSGAISFMIECDDQAEVDHYWDGLGDGGEYWPCGWLTDRFGVTWQVTPKALLEMTKDEDTKRVGNMTIAMMKMKRLDIATLKAAFAEDD